MPCQDRAFPNFLQLLLPATPNRDALRNSNVRLEGRDLSYIEFVHTDLRGLSFRNCNLADTIFRDCELQESRFEGAQLVGTRFEQLPSEALKGAQFGNLEHFEFIYLGKQRMDNLDKMAERIQRATGRAETFVPPCPAALQKKGCFLSLFFQMEVGAEMSCGKVP